MAGLGAWEESLQIALTMDDFRLLEEAWKRRVLVPLLLEPPQEGLLKALPDAILLLARLKERQSPQCQ